MLNMVFFLFFRLINAIQQVIDTTDKEIDQMVYALYELSEEEIKIVETTLNK